MSPNIGDVFPQDWKDDFTERNFQIGCILKLFDLNTTPPKEKRFIIIGFDNEKIFLVTVFINSEINTNIFTTPEQISWHLPISSKDREYIDKDCYIDCSQLIPREANELKELMKKTPSIHIGNLSDEDLKKVKAIIKTCKRISIAQKKRFGLFF